MYESGATFFHAGSVGVSGTGVVSVVRPFALHLPLRAVAEVYRRNVEGPGALIAIFLTRGVVPSTVAWIGAGFREFMSAHIGDSRQTLRINSRAVCFLLANGWRLPLRSAIVGRGGGDRACVLWQC